MEDQNVKNENENVTGSEQKAELVDERDSKIEQLQQKLKDFEDKYVRVFSEFENYKRRLEREKNDIVAYSLEKFSKDLLPVVDALEMAVQSANNHSDVSKLKEGVELTLRNLSSVLDKNGVEKIATNNGFDPNVHQAVMKVDGGNIKSGEIVAVLQNGYKLKDRVLRATMVSVAN